jgi:hypothetical protein
MAGKGQARDKNGRFAPSRLSFARAYHGTTSGNAANIKQRGYKASSEGAQGAGVYLSSSRRQAASYGTAVLAHRIPKSRIVESKPLKTAASVKQRYKDLDANKAIKIKGTGDKIVLTNAKVANRSLIRNETGRIRPTKKRR